MKAENDIPVDKPVSSTTSLHEDKIQSINHVKVTELSTIGENKLETSGAREYILESSLEASNLDTSKAGEYSLESSLDMSNLGTSEAGEYTLESSLEANIWDASGEDKIVVSINEHTGSRSEANIEQEEEGVVPAINKNKDDSFRGSGDTVLSPNAKKFLEKVPY